MGKSRLSSVLNDNERAVLNRMLLEQTLEVITGTDEIGQTLVVSRDPQALAIAREFGARTVLEDGAPNLNAALGRATMLARAHAERGVLVLPADLPHLNHATLQGFIQHGGGLPEVIIAPDRHNVGTNALLVNPAGLIDYFFGPESFDRHCDAARQINARLEVVQDPRLGLDLDTPEDLQLVEIFDKQVIRL
jgi:2-phospho-L-lactate guanylyltransferase